MRALTESHEIIELVDVMNRLEFMAVCFTKAQFSPYVPEIAMRDSRTLFPDRFESSEDARRHLLLFLIWALTISESGEHIDDEPEEQTRVDAKEFDGLLETDGRYCFEALDRWLELFREMQGRLHIQEDESTEDLNHAYDFAWILYLCAKVTIHAEFSGSEMSYDEFTTEFADIIASAKRISPAKQDWFSFEDGMLKFSAIVRLC